MIPLELGLEFGIGLSLGLLGGGESLLTAVGTSLIIIAMNSMAGFLGHLTNGSLDWMVTLVFTSTGLVGTFLGMRLSRLLSSSRL